MPEGSCCVVAVGHGGDAAPATAPQELAAELRHLLDAACAATFGDFPQAVRVSVAPGGVMLAFPDATPQRAIQLCEALMAQLQHQRDTHHRLLPVCAAVTYGPMRPVDVLGHTTNFEGRPAIAAARILAKLQAGQVAVEESV